MSPVTDNAVNSGWSGDHELSEFLDQDLAELAREDARIRRRASEDPGTAGDEGEAVWAALLTRWLAPYQVVTKGRVLFPDGWASPQVDVVVLRRSYPPRLLDKKMFISSPRPAARSASHVVSSISPASPISQLGRSLTTSKCQACSVRSIGPCASQSGGPAQRAGARAVHALASGRVRQRTGLPQPDCGSHCAAQLVGWRGRTQRLRAIADYYRLARLLGQGDRHWALDSPTIVFGGRSAQPTRGRRSRRLAGPAPVVPVLTKAGVAADGRHGTRWDERIEIHDAHGVSSVV